MYVADILGGSTTTSTGAVRGRRMCLARNSSLVISIGTCPHCHLGASFSPIALPGVRSSL